jgi:hypothetical protein
MIPGLAMISSALSQNYTSEYQGHKHGREPSGNIADDIGIQ